VAAFDSFAPAQLTFQASRLISGVSLGALCQTPGARSLQQNETNSAEDSERYSNSAI
jgi:hypothetical protein